MDKTRRFVKSVGVLWQSFVTAHTIDTILLSRLINQYGKTKLYSIFNIHFAPNYVCSLKWTDIDERPLGCGDTIYQLLIMLCAVRKCAVKKIKMCR
jgi:hypothetical protein